MIKKIVYISSLLLVFFVMSCTDNTSDVMTEEKGKEELKEEGEKEVFDVSILKQGDRIMMSQGLERKFRLKIPSSYHPDTPMAVVFALHGANGTVEKMDNSTQFHVLGEQEGFITVYPEGLPISKNKKGETINNWTLRGSATFNEIKYRDDTFLRELTTLLSTELNIDEERVFMCGSSNGGIFSYLYARYRTNYISAVGNVGGYQWSYKDKKDIDGDYLPVIHLHGLKDGIIKPEHAEPSATYWAERNGASETAIVLQDTDDLRIREWASGSENNGDVKLYEFKNKGHIWFKHKNSPVSATEEIWKFFKAHPKKAIIIASEK